MSAQANSDTIDLKVIFNKVRSNWYWFAICAAICGAGAVAYKDHTEDLLGKCYHAAERAG